jgi:hypothetical protein
MTGGYYCAEEPAHPAHDFNKPNGDTYKRMNNSNSSSNPRVTLKLKAGARKSPREPKTPPPPQPQSKANLKPGAHWSDEYKERMQADMDLLSR